MNRADKLKILQDSLQGKSTLLHQVYLQRKAKAMPLAEVHGVIDVRQCSPLLMDLPVVDGESIIDGECILQSLSEWLANWQRVGKKSSYRYDNAYTSIAANSDIYDAVPLAFIQLQRPNYLYASLPGGTVADLRKMYQHCAVSVQQAFIVLVIETDLSHYKQRHATT